MRANRTAANESGIHIAIDLTALMPVQTGVDRYVTELVFELAKIDESNRYTVFVNSADRSVFDGRLPENFHIIPCCLRPRPVRFAIQQILLPLVCAGLSADVMHSPSFIMPYCRGRQRHLLTIHDMTFFSMPQVHNLLHRSAAFKRLVLTSIRRADLINVPSRATRDALMEWVPGLSEEKVRVTEFGIASSFHATSPEQILRETRRLGLPDAYLLFVGNIEPRKNLKLLVETYRKLVIAGEISEHLVLAGRHDSAFQSLFEDVQASELRGRVHLPGFIAEADLPWLYRGARLFVYPSLGEGFGFPPLEAMACAVPVISTLGSSLEENLNGAAELVPPQDLNALADAILRLLRDDVLREQRIRDGLRRAAAFRSEDSARKILRCYRELGRKSPRVV